MRESARGRRTGRRAHGRGLRTINSMSVGRKVNTTAAHRRKWWRFGRWGQEKARISGQASDGPSAGTLWPLARQRFCAGSAEGAECRAEQAGRGVCPHP